MVLYAQLSAYDYCKVLKSDRDILLVNETLVNTYKAELDEEVEPAVNELIEKATHGLKQLQRKEAVLQTKAEALKSLPAKPASGTMAQHTELDQRKLHGLREAETAS